jgi:hypothetical protein
LRYIFTFEAVFLMHLMRDVLKQSTYLSKMLQEKSLNMLTAVNQISVYKDMLAEMLGDESFDLLLSGVVTFCEKFVSVCVCMYLSVSVCICMYLSVSVCICMFLSVSVYTLLFLYDSCLFFLCIRIVMCVYATSHSRTHRYEIAVPDFTSRHVAPGRSARNAIPISVYQHFKNVMEEVLQKELEELNGRFSETTSELMECMSALDPGNKFDDWNATKEERLVRLLKFYPREFPDFDATAVELKSQLRAFTKDMSKNFVAGQDLEDLSVYMVSMGLHNVFPVIYKLVVLVLTLPVTTASGERSFSKMKLIEECLRSKMSQFFLRALMMLGIEKELAAT